MTPPTPRTAECLAAIEKLTRNGVPPSWRSLGEELGLSQSNVHVLLERMKERGLVDWEPRRGHSLRILNQDPDFASMTTPALLRMFGRIDAILCDRSAA